MNIIKLNAIDSTNEFLKKLKRDSQVADFTVVSADYQSDGKGQMGTNWESEIGKNLMVSILKKNLNINICNQFYISIAVASAVYRTLEEYIPLKISIKWPNDILSAKDKIAGILIENTISDSFICDSIIGIGVNINQIEFSSEIKNVTSLKKILLEDVDRDEFLQKMLNYLILEFFKLENNEIEKLKVFYESNLYKKEIPTMFKDHRNQIFLGKIKGVSDAGKLIVELENDQFKTFNLKEISLI